MKKLIVIEGIDGIGKTTQYNLLKNKLSISNKIVTHHFPSYGEDQAILITKYLNGEFGDIKSLSPYFINSLYAIDRSVTWNKLLKEKYGKEIILLDRYTTSSLIYQSALIDDIEEKKKFIDFILDYEYNKLGLPKPDCVIFLYASFDLICKLRNERISNDGVLNDIHEKDIKYMKKVYDNALFVADYLNFNKINCSCNNEMKSIEEIHDEICKIIM